MSESVQLVAEASFPCRYGDFRIFGFRAVGTGVEQEFVVLAKGDLPSAPAPLLRIHSRCLTGDVFRSLRCDCGPQLSLALAKIEQAGSGLLIYDPQEGRGIGLLNKLMAYQLQDQGADTVEANQRLGFGADERNYSSAVAILRHFGISAVRMLSNNPAKVDALESGGIAVVERVPCDPEDAGDLARSYLRTKRDKLGHMLDGM
ncbi:MAG: GTP cyclohydrolase II [Bryobacterales bacterium]|nr:GTP cyclohydrolase II [Bryobacterales bacterium]